MKRPLYVDVSPMLAKQLTGLGRFTARLVEALAQVASLRLFTWASWYELKRANMRTDLTHGDEISIDVGSLQEADGDLQAWAHALLRHPRARLNFSVAQECACLYTVLRPDQRHFAREVSILYDFTPLILPWAHEESTRREFGQFFSQTARCSDKALAISAATHSDARWLCSLSSEDIVVAYPGPSLCLRDHVARAPTERLRQLILVVSTLEPRKNAALVRDWFFETQVLASDAELWWVGPRGWLWNPPRRSRGQHRGRTFKFVGMVPDSRLCELYRRASFTIYPSLYEGFGFPVLDSLLHGTPVACSFNSSLKEFAGPGVFYFDACDAASLDSACRDLLASLPSALERTDLRQRCSWDSLAATVVSLCS